MTDKLTDLLGICRRAGRLAVGYDAAAKWITHDKAKAVVLAADISDKTEKEIRFMIAKHPVLLLRSGADKESLGLALGKRKPIAAIATDDKGFAAAMQIRCRQEQEEDAV